MTAFSGTLVLPEGRIEEGWLAVKDGVIDSIELGAPPSSVGAETFPGCLIGPGFIDLHVHGGDGGDFMAGTRESVQRVLGYHGAHGTTSLLATTIAASDEAVAHALEGIRAQIDEQADTDARALPDVLGAHLEGPYISLARSGGQDADTIRSPSVDEFSRWAQLAPVRMITLAPEVEGGMELVRYLAEHRPEVILSAGHTDATYPELLAAIEQGVSHMTHFMSGMSPFNHRDPGAAGTGLLSERLTLDVIPDLIHMHPDVLRFIIRSKDPRNVAIITDAVNFAGLPDGDYEKRDRAYLVKDGLVRLKSNGSLAGSTLTMERGVKNVIDLGVSVSDAWAMGSAVPAALLGIGERKGELRVGADADLTIVDGAWAVHRSLARGRTVYARPRDGIRTTTHNTESAE